MPRCTVLAGTVALFTLALAAMPAHAQSLEIGGRLGPAITTVAGDGDTDSKLGFSIGGFAGFRLGERVTIYGELSFIRKGFSSEGQYILSAGGGVVRETTLQQTVHLDYLELQVPLSLTFPTGGSLRPRLYAGPSLALELRCGAGWAVRNVFLDWGTGTVIGSEEIEVTGGCLDQQDIFLEGPLFQETNTIDVGILFGGGLDIRIGSGALTVDVRYNLGLIDIGESPATLKNRAFQVLLGYSYFLR
ncbi:MAG: PorT family protein [Gemmatimonadota bacterium]|nr:MAG: PorT family protein [Gemmatimonadota bacterium]